METGAAPPAHPLIASDRVHGTEVRGPDGTRLGQIERLMIDKVSGRVACAVLRFGGLLGLGAEYRTLPWSALTFDPAADAYVLDLDAAHLREGPARSPEGGAPEEDGTWEEHVHRYPNAAPERGL